MASDNSSEIGIKILLWYVKQNNYLLSSRGIIFKYICETQDYQSLRQLADKTGMWYDYVNNLIRELKEKDMIEVKYVGRNKLIRVKTIER